MRGLTRLIMMFAPMIINQVQRYQRNKQREQERRYQKPQNRTYGNKRSQNDRYEQAPMRTPPPPSKPKKPELTEEEKNFRLKEEDIMLDPKTMAEYKETKNRKPQLPELTPRDNKVSSETKEIKFRESKNQDTHMNSDKTDKKEGFIEPESDLDLRDIFFNDESE